MQVNYIGFADSITVENKVYYYYYYYYYHSVPLYIVVKFNKCCPLQTPYNFVWRSTITQVNLLIWALVSCEMTIWLTWCEINGSGGPGSPPSSLGWPALPNDAVSLILTLLLCLLYLTNYKGHEIITASGPHLNHSFLSPKVRRWLLSSLNCGNSWSRSTVAKKKVII